MSDQKAIHEAVTAFGTWDLPWTFHAAVLAALEPDARDEFESVWRAALATEHWKSTDLETCAKTAADALNRQFPELSSVTVDSIVRAAAYQLR